MKSFDPARRGIYASQRCIPVLHPIGFTNRKFHPHHCRDTLDAVYFAARQIYSFNEANSPEWNPKLKNYVEKLKSVSAVLFPVCDSIDVRRVLWGTCDNVFVRFVAWVPLRSVLGTNVFALLRLSLGSWSELRSATFVFLA